MNEAGAITGKPVDRVKALRAEALRRELAKRQPSPTAPPPVESPNPLLATAKAAALAPGIGLGETVATLLGAPTSFVSGAASLAGFPNISEYLKPGTIEGQRDFLNVPEMRAAQDMENVPAAARIPIRGLEMAAGGLAPNAGLAKLIASNPGAVTKIGAIIDTAAGSAGEIAAQIAAALGMDEDTQEAGRAWTGLVTAMGGPAAVNGARSAFLGAKDVFVPKPEGRLRTEVGSTLAGDGVDPAAFATARTNAAEFRDAGMQPPPLGSLTGDPVLMAEQQAALRSVPGMAGREQARQVATDTQIRGTMNAATPVGDVQDVSTGLADNAAAQALAARQRQAALDEELMQMQVALLKGKEANAELVRQAGMNLDDAVRTLTERAEARAMAAVDALGGGMSARAAGDVFVDELGKTRTEFRQNANRAYETILAGTEDVPVDVAGIRAGAVTALAPGDDLTAGGVTLPPILKAIAESTAETQTPRQLQSIRSNLLDALRQAQGGATENPAAARRISIVLDAVDETFEKLNGVVPGMDALNQWYRAGKQALSGGRFKDVGRELRSRGGVELDPSEVAARFIRADTQTGADEAMEQFNAAYGRHLGLEPQAGLPAGVPSIVPSGIAQKALDEHIIGDMMLYAADPVTGKVDGKKLAEWVGRHKIALDRRPAIRDKVGSAAKAQVLADAEMKRIAELKASYERDVLKGMPSDPEAAARIKAKEREIRDFERGRGSAERRFNRLFELAIDDPQGRLRQIAGAEPVTAARDLRKLERELRGNPEALAGMRAGLWKELTARVVDPVTGAAAPSPLTNADSFARLMDSHGPLIRQMFGPDRTELLTTMQRLAKRNVAAGGKLPHVAEEGGKNRVGALLSHLVSRSWGVARGVVGLPYVVTEGLARAVFGNRSGELNQAAAQRLLERALTDVDTYEALTQLARFPKNQTAQRKLAARLSYGRQAAGIALDDRPLRTRQDIAARRARLGQ